MAETVISTESISVIGGPSKISIDVDYGAQGVRGTYIFTGDGKPTDPNVDFPDPNVYDLYINLKPSDTEYLFLYQYLNTNGVIGWVRTLRLIPTTALANTPILFFAGEVVTVLTTVTLTEPIDYATILPKATTPIASDYGLSSLVDGLLWLDISTTGAILSPWQLKMYDADTSTWGQIAIVYRGSYLPLAAFFNLEDLGTLEGSEFNVQYNILNEKPIISGMTIGDIVEIQNQQYLPLFLKAKELNDDGTFTAITGTKTVHVFITAGIGPIPGTV